MTIQEGDQWKRTSYGEGVSSFDSWVGRNSAGNCSLGLSPVKTLSEKQFTVEENSCEDLNRVCQRDSMVKKVLWSFWPWDKMLQTGRGTESPGSLHNHGLKKHMIWKRGRNCLVPSARDLWHKRMLIFNQDNNLKRPAKATQRKEKLRKKTTWMFWRTSKTEVKAQTSIWWKICGILVKNATKAKFCWSWLVCKGKKVKSADGSKTRWRHSYF